MINASQVTNPPIDPTGTYGNQSLSWKKPEQVHRLADGTLDCALPPQLELSMPVMFSAMNDCPSAIMHTNLWLLPQQSLESFIIPENGGLHEDFYCYGKNTIVQVASGRFGVHEEY